MKFGTPKQIFRSFVCVLVTTILVGSGLRASHADDNQTNSHTLQTYGEQFWTDTYFGISGGWAENSQRINYNCSNISGAICFSAGGPFQASDTFSPDGVLIGVTSGINQQIGPSVFGLEVDGSWTDWDGTASFSYAAPFSPSVVTGQREINWLTTFRARIGLSTNDIFIFATGGLAVGQVTLSTTWIGNPTTSANFFGSNTDLMPGWIAGGGIEIPFDDYLTFKAEGLYFDLGEISVLSTDPQFPTQTYFASSDTTGTIARVGVNWKTMP